MCSIMLYVEINQGVVTQTSVAIFRVMLDLSANHVEKDVYDVYSPSFITPRIWQIGGC